MSRHIVNDGKLEYAFGWDQHLQSFFLQVHDSNVSEEENPVLWLSPPGTIMYEIEDLVLEARKHGLHIDRVLQTRLYADKDDGV